MNKPDSKQDVKTYYSYELDDNKKMIKYINWGAWLFSLIALVSFIFVITSLGTTIPMIIMNATKHIQISDMIIRA